MTSFLLLQTGDYLLLQTSGKIILASSVSGGDGAGGGGKRNKLREQIARDDEEVMSVIEKFLEAID